MALVKLRLLNDLTYLLPYSVHKLFKRIAITLWMFFLSCQSSVSVKVEEKCSVLSREKNELQSRTEENDEEVDELMKKFKAAVQQVHPCVHCHYE